MAMLPNINLLKNDINQLLRYAIAEGGEAIICPGVEEDSLLKLFLNPNQRNFTANHTIKELSEMSDNKFHKIDELYQQNIDYMVRPLSTISCNGQLLGYQMTYDKSDIALNDPRICRTIDEFAHYAIVSQQILEYFKQQEIVYGDIAPRNILINPKTKTVKFCDIDNIQFQDYPIDTLTRDLKMYQATRGIDNETDAYMHNLMVLKKFYLDLDDIEVNEELCLDYLENKHYQFINQ